MKKWMFVLLALIAMSSLSAAQVPNPISLHVGGAISIPSSPQAFADAYKTGFHGWGGIGYKFMPNFQAIGKIEYHRFALDIDSDPLLADQGVTGGHNNMFMYGADGRFTFNLPQAPIKPFVLGGLGFARMSMSDLEGSSSLVASFNDYKPEAQTEMYYNIGAGIEMKAGPMWNLFLQVRYVSVATEGEASSFIPISLGIKFF